MNAIKYLIPVWLSIVVYAGLSLFSGAVGFLAYDQLVRERDRQQQNLEALQELNRKLKGDTDALLYDSDTIAAYARELGYGRSEERFVRIVGLSNRRKQNHDPGQIISAAKPQFMAESDIRFIAFACGLGLFSCILALDLLRTRRTEIH
ncbi:MAG: septum formation initiator family protein [Treponema sp.]|jgi:cell division protein FtsB|nr:septum formation initiator family protein [Treponema sp.]